MFVISISISFELLVKLWQHQEADLWWNGSHWCFRNASHQCFSEIHGSLLCFLRRTRVAVAFLCSSVTSIRYTTQFYIHASRVRKNQIQISTRLQHGSASIHQNTLKHIRTCRFHLEIKTTQPPLRRILQKSWSKYLLHTNLRENSLLRKRLSRTSRNTSTLHEQQWPDIRVVT